MKRQIETVVRHEKRFKKLAGLPYELLLGVVLVWILVSFLRVAIPNNAWHSEYFEDASRPNELSDSRQEGCKPTQGAFLLVSRIIMPVCGGGPQRGHCAT